MAHVLANDLREAILQAAVQGKLSKKEESDSSIESIMESLHFDTKLEKSEEPYDLPAHWRWVQVGNLGETNDTNSFADGPFGSNLKKEHQINQPEVRIIQLSNIGDNGWVNDNVKYTSYSHLKTISRCEVKPGDFVIAKMMPAGRTIIVPELQTKIVLGSDAVKFVPNKCLNKDYLLLTMKSNCFLSQVYSEVHGITRVRTSLSKIKSYYLPIPPIEEQARIVAKVDELMAKIDEYEKLEKELTELKEKFPGEMRDAILQAAMSGKISIQSNQDTKMQIISTFYDDTRFDIPDTWQWCNLKDLLSIKTGKKDQNYATDDGIYNFYTCAKEVFKAPDYSFEGESLILPGNGANVGEVTLYDGKFEAYQRTYVLQSEHKKLNMKFMYYSLLENWNEYNKTKMFGSAIPYIKLGNLQNYPVPLPPVEEQQRIVDKLDKLLPMCDELVKLC